MRKVRNRSNLNTRGKNGFGIPTGRKQINVMPILAESVQEHGDIRLAPTPSRLYHGVADRQFQMSALAALKEKSA
jgi:hypothetical protein